MRKKIISIVFAIMLLFIIEKNSDAASASIQCSGTATVNSPVTITVSGSAVQWNLSLKVNGKEIASSNELDNVNGNKTISFSGSYTPTVEGTLTISLEGSVTEANDGSTTKNFSSKTISVTKATNGENDSNDSKDNNKNNNSGNEGKPEKTNTSKSNIATLSNLGIKPNDFSGFSPSKTSYSVTVPNEVESVEVYAKGQSGQKITGTGVKKLVEGENTVNVVVTAEDGKATKTYTINITRDKKEQEEKDEEKPEEVEVVTFGLAELKIDNIELQPQFQTDIYEYKADLTENIEKLNIITLSTEANTSIEITGNENLQEGENIITIIVKDQNEEKTAAYQIIVNKKIKEEQNTIDQEEQQQEKIKRIVIVVGIDVLIIIFIIIIKVKKSKEKKDIYMPYRDIMNNYNGDEPEEIDNKEEVFEETKKKKHSKGKRYK